MYMVKFNFKGSGGKVKCDTFIDSRTMGGLHEWLLRHEAPVRDEVLRLQAHPPRGVHDHLG